MTEANPTHVYTVYTRSLPFLCYEVNFVCSGLCAVYIDMYLFTLVYLMACLKGRACIKGLQSYSNILFLDCIYMCIRCAPVFLECGHYLCV